jgi:hypothetical protein
MEILKVGVFMYLFYNLSWQSLFTLICFYNIVIYNINNKHLLMNNPNFFLVIMTLESLSFYAQVTDLYLKKYFIKMKQKIVSFIYPQLYLEETSNEIKINDLEDNNTKEDKKKFIESDDDALKFLNSLKKIKE